MNIKIKSAGVSCLIDGYDRMYATLKKQLGESDEQLFTERIPGYEYLQWELPGEGWTPLSEGDPLMANEVKKELVRRQQAVSIRFGQNQDVARRVLSVPDESYVYYKPDSSGRLLIRLTAWGYSYPERVLGGDASGKVEPKKQTEHVSLQVLYDGKPVPDKALLINGFHKTTDVKGFFDIGDLPIGYLLDIDVDQVHQHITVMPGQGKVIMDVTVFTMVEVTATLDGQPYKTASPVLTYGRHQIPLTLDDNGEASVKLPLDIERELCKVVLDSEVQQMPLSGELTVFTFHLKTPEVVTKEEEDIPEVVERSHIVEKPVLESVTEPLQDPVATPLQNSVADFLPILTTVEVEAVLDGQPYKGASAVLSYDSHRMVLTTDGNGTAMVKIPWNPQERLATVTLDDETQQKLLPAEGVTTFVFQLETSEVLITSEDETQDVPLPKSSFGIYLLETLAVLAILALIVYTYLLCVGMLFV